MAPRTVSQEPAPIPPPPVPVEDDNNSDNPDDGVHDATFWKHKYQHLQAEVEKKKKGKQPTLVKLGRGIRRLVTITLDLEILVMSRDKHVEYVKDPSLLGDEFDRLNAEERIEKIRGWERDAQAIKQLNRFIPNFTKVITEKSPEELETFYKQLHTGATNARSDDLNRIKELVARWLNQRDPAPSPLLDEDDHDNRGIAHNVTGRLLCPIEFDWDDPEVRAKIRALDDDYDWCSSFHARAFYAKHKGDDQRLEDGFLMSSLLVKVFRAIFTSPSSAADVIDDTESDDDADPETVRPRKKARTSRNRKKKPTQRTVASILKMDGKVTPRAIAYAAVMTGERWDPTYGGFDYVGLYNYIVDFFEDLHDPLTKKRARELLLWWDEQAFPNFGEKRLSKTTASRNAMKAQRAARSEAARASAAARRGNRA
ncbi:hypothetical protein CVT26_013569 [Gymnopilus dilepis]|uniref:Uncharacterized protein n=1 Tax=Gymnopilus dilepis TaxID=231916 RepID=A0A409WSY7_9AGAR|nr:hypothetical protein CVT26_013569 [Gymnopilus dilepis]